MIEEKILEPYKILFSSFEVHLELLKKPPELRLDSRDIFFYDFMQRNIYVHVDDYKSLL